MGISKMNLAPWEDITLRYLLGHSPHDDRQFFIIHVPLQSCRPSCSTVSLQLDSSTSVHSGMANKKMNNNNKTKYVVLCRSSAHTVMLHPILIARCSSRHREMRGVLLPFGNLDFESAVTAQNDEFKAVYGSRKTQ